MIQTRLQPTMASHQEALYGPPRGLRHDKWLDSDDSALDGETRLFRLQHIDDFHFIRPKLTKHQNPFIAELDYRQDLMPTTRKLSKVYTRSSPTSEPSSDMGTPVITVRTGKHSPRPLPAS